ncbi:MAG: hypothetical protein AB7J32_01745 [Pseudonocardia sp.]
MTSPFSATVRRRAARIASAALSGAAVLALSGCGLMGATSSLLAPTDAQGVDAVAAPGSLDACSLLPQQLAQQVVGGRSLVTESVPGGPECLWVSPQGTEPSENYSVDLDVSAADDAATTLASAREGYTGGHVIAEETGFGDGAFRATVGTFASIDCVSGGVLHDITVSAPSDPPSAEAQNLAVALKAARTLATRYCTTTTTSAPKPASTGGSLDACSLLPQQLAQQVVGGRSLVTESVPGGPECLWVSPQGTEPSENYSVDLDVSAADDAATTLASAREGYTGGHVIAEETGFGDGAFRATVGTFASIDCVSGGVLHDITVSAPSDPPSAEAQNLAVALKAARTLATRYCTS